MKTLFAPLDDTHSHPWLKVLALILVVALSLSTALGAQIQYGKFNGPVCAKWDRVDNRSMTICAPFSFVDPDGVHWDVPVGTVVDGASIPQAFWSIIGGPFEGPYRNASVVHDYFCEVKTRPWQKVHRMFYFGMLAGGTALAKAKVMYYAVLVGGPRWKDVQYTNHAPRAFPKPGDKDYIKKETWSSPVDQKDAERDAKWIEQTDPTLDEIEALAQKSFKGREPADVVRLDLQ